jgi:hypothetical protein
MVTSSKPEEASGRPELMSSAYCFDTLSSAVAPFVARHFGWAGTWRLHRDAFGWDILRAPVNVVLAPVFVLTRLIAFVFGRLGWQRGSAWLLRRRILLRTAVSRRVEQLLIKDFLAHPDGLDNMIARQSETVDRAVARRKRVMLVLSDYAGTRSAVAEITTMIFTLAIGAFVFQAVTPGMFSMAPGVADVMARAAAVADFPFGRTLGGMWYGTFAPDAAPWLVTATLVGLIMAGSVFAAFAGILADPVQGWLGIHRRRLLRLIDTIEAEISGDDKPFTAREHFYARFADLFDAAASVFRIFRS